jgi:hypothetical protein
MPRIAIVIIKMFIVRVSPDMYKDSLICNMKIAFT